MNRNRTDIFPAILELNPNRNFLEEPFRTNSTTGSAKGMRLLQSPENRQYFLRPYGTARGVLLGPTLPLHSTADRNQLYGSSQRSHWFTQLYAHDRLTCTLCTESARTAYTERRQRAVVVEDTACAHGACSAQAQQRIGCAVRYAFCSLILLYFQ